MGPLSITIKASAKSNSVLLVGYFYNYSYTTGCSYTINTILHNKTLYQIFIYFNFKINLNGIK